MYIAVDVAVAIVIAVAIAISIATAPHAWQPSNITVRTYYAVPYVCIAKQLATSKYIFTIYIHILPGKSVHVAFL